MSHTGLDSVRRLIPPHVTLVAVSKTFGASDIVPVIEAGQRVFGENRVQEAKAKWPELKSRWPGIGLHLVGPLQSNKAAEAVALFDCIHSIDRPKIAQAIAAEMEKQGRQLQLFIQINTGREPQKAGIDPGEADSFIASCGAMPVIGLMCIPPAHDDPVPHFDLLKSIAQRNNLSKLSMGMSGDFETAIRHGATHVRIGSAIFGTRT